MDVTLQQFYDMLERHDWGYNYSDDPGVWKRGHDNDVKLSCIAKSGPEFAQLHLAYAAYQYDNGPKPVVGLGVGIHEISEDVYHADPCWKPSLSGSVAIPLVHKSPKHAWHKHVRLNPNHSEGGTKRAEFGSAAHAMLLGKGADVVFLDAKDFRKDAVKEKRDELSAKGKIVLLAKDEPALSAMMVVAKEYLSACGVDLSKGKPEQVLIWQEGDEWCRGMVDWLSDDLMTVLDYKTTGLGAHPREMGRSLYDQDYHLKAAFYERGLNKIDPDPRHIGRRQMLFFYQEIEPPYACSLVKPSEGGMTIGRKQATYAIQTWQRCMATNMWPAYGVGVSVVSPPPWVEKAWLERETEEDAATGETSPDGYVAPHEIREVNVGD